MASKQEQTEENLLQFPRPHAINLCHQPLPPDLIVVMRPKDMSPIPMPSLMMVLPSPNAPPKRCVARK